VHRLVSEQQQYCGADVTALGPSAASSFAARSAAAHPASAARSGSFGMVVPAAFTYRSCESASSRVFLM